MPASPVSHLSAVPSLLSVSGFPPGSYFQVLFSSGTCPKFPIPQDIYAIPGYRISILSYYKNALRLRNQNPEIARGTIEKVESLCKDSQAAITKTYQDSTIGIVYNLGEGNGTVDLKKTALENMNLEGSLTLKEETVQLKDGKLEMPACSIAVLK